MVHDSADMLFVLQVYGHADITCFFFCLFACFGSFQAREEAAAAAAEVTHDVAQTPTVLKEPVLYSDPAALLNRGYDGWWWGAGAEGSGGGGELISLLALVI